MIALSLVIWVGAVYVSLTSATATCTLKTETDPTRCGVKAAISPGALAVFGTIFASKLTLKEDCAGYCAGRINSHQTGDIHDTVNPVGSDYTCNSFFFDEKAGICQLLSQNLAYARLNRSASHSSKVFYQADCFDCGNVCDQTFHEQLLDNGGFEDGTFGPWVSQLGEQAPGRNSKYSYQCIQRHTSPPCYLVQGFNSCKRSLYMIRFDYLAAERYLINEYQLIISNFKVSEIGKTWRTAWVFQKDLHHYTYPQTAPPGKFQIELQEAYYVKGRMKMKIDNAYVSRIPNPPSIIQGARNLVVNPGFESGKLQPWTQYPEAKARFVSPGLNGSKYAFICVGCNIIQTISTTPGKAYLFEFDYLNSLKAQTYIYFGFDTGHHSLTYQISSWVSSRKASMPFVADDANTNITISMNPDDNVTIYLDNISVREVDI